MDLLSRLEPPGRVPPRYNTMGTDLMADTVDFTLDTSVAADQVVVEVQGQVDERNAARLADQLAKLIDHGRPHLILDLGRLTAIDSPGLGVIVAAVKRARSLGGEIVLRTPTRAFERILERSGLRQYLTIVASSRGSSPQA